MEKELYSTKLRMLHTSLCNSLLDIFNHQLEGKSRVARLHANNAIKRDGDLVVLM